MDGNSPQNTSSELSKSHAHVLPQHSTVPQALGGPCSVQCSDSGARAGDTIVCWCCVHSHSRADVLRCVSLLSVPPTNSQAQMSGKTLETYPNPGPERTPPRKVCACTCAAIPRRSCTATPAVAAVPLPAHRCLRLPDAPLCSRGRRCWCAPQPFVDESCNKETGNTKYEGVT